MVPRIMPSICVTASCACEQNACVTPMSDFHGKTESSRVIVVVVVVVVVVELVVVVVASEVFY